jgi:hypothetical protein
MIITLTTSQKAAVASYLRSVIGALAAVIATGNYAPEDLAKAAVAALLPPVLRWVNPKDAAFGRGADKP